MKLQLIFFAYIPFSWRLNITVVYEFVHLQQFAAVVTVRPLFLNTEMYHIKWQGRPTSLLAAGISIS
jgi:hypothetical protein